MIYQTYRAPWSRLKRERTPGVSKYEIYFDRKGKTIVKNRSSSDRDSMRRWLYFFHLFFLFFFLYLFIFFFPIRSVICRGIISTHESKDNSAFQILTERMENGIPHAIFENALFLLVSNASLRSVLSRWYNKAFCLLRSSVYNVGRPSFDSWLNLSTLQNRPLLVKRTRKKR